METLFFDHPPQPGEILSVYTIDPLGTRYEEGKKEGYGDIVITRVLMDTVVKWHPIEQKRFARMSPSVEFMLRDDKKQRRIVRQAYWPDCDEWVTQ